MPEITLVHCTPVQILVPQDAPVDVILGYSVGGSAGGGHVDVTAAPGEIPGPVSLPTGGTGTLPIAKVTQLTVHYRKFPGGPDSVSFGYTVTVVP